jgi:hypothetical protein
LKTLAFRAFALLASITLAGAASVTPARAADDELNAMVRVRLTTEPQLAAGCTRIGAMSDDNVKDLRRKIVRAGGNTAVISFNAMEMSVLLAEVFRCSTTPNGPSIPSPPAGAPPPPPPAR